MTQSGSDRLAAFSAWLTAFGDAWESGSADDAAALFVVGATAQPAPFDRMARGRRAISGWLIDRFAGWPNARFAAEVLGAGDTYGVAHWRVTSGARALDGILLCALDDRGRCTSLRLWSHEGPVFD